MFTWVGPSSVSASATKRVGSSEPSVPWKMESSRIQRQSTIPQEALCPVSWWKLKIVCYMYNEWIQAGMYSWQDTHIRAWHYGIISLVKVLLLAMKLADDSDADSVTLSGSKTTATPPWKSEKRSQKDREEWRKRERVGRETTSTVDWQT